MLPFSTTACIPGLDPTPENLERLPELQREHIRQRTREQISSCTNGSNSRTRRCMLIVEPYAKAIELNDIYAGIALLQKIEWAGRIS